MPPRFVYWTIIFDGQPTAFRSATRDELLPTFKQIQSRHPDAQLRYFARGKLWYSDEEARAALARERFEKSQKHRPDRSRQRSASSGLRAGDRGPAWRPGGQHSDPRARFKVPRDVKRAKMAHKFGWKRKEGGGPRGPKKDDE